MHVATYKSADSPLIPSQTLLQSLQATLTEAVLVSPILQSSDSYPGQQES